MSELSSGTLTGVTNAVQRHTVRGAMSRYGIASRLTAVAIAGWALALASLLFISQRSVELTLPRLTGDVAGLAEFHPLTGALSTLGLLLWAVALGAAAVGWLSVRDRVDPALVRLVASTAVLTALLLLDDAFQFHEALGRRYLGIPELVVLGVWPALTLAWLAINRRALPRTPLGLLAMAFALFALSLTIDVWFVPDDDPSYFAEDAFKFGGILFWALYSLRLTEGVIREGRRADEITPSA